MSQAARQKVQVGLCTLRATARLHSSVDGGCDLTHLYDGEALTWICGVAPPFRTSTRSLPCHNLACSLSASAHPPSVRPQATAGDSPSPRALWGRVLHPRRIL